MWLRTELKHERLCQLTLPSEFNSIVSAVLYSTVIIRPGDGSPSATNVVLVGVGAVLLSDLRSATAKAFSFHNRSSRKFAYTYATTFSTIAP